MPSELSSLDGTPVLNYDKKMLVFSYKILDFTKDPDRTQHSIKSKFFSRLN